MVAGESSRVDSTRRGLEWARQVGRRQEICLQRMQVPNGGQKSYRAQDPSGSGCECYPSYVNSGHSKWPDLEGISSWLKPNEVISDGEFFFLNKKKVKKVEYVFVTEQDV